MFCLYICASYLKTLRSVSPSKIPLRVHVPDLQIQQAGAECRSHAPALVLVSTAFGGRLLTGFLPPASQLCSPA